ncbi:hypothetical protein [Priestia megaterium]|uniref:hypothetical protein n=1 Tax=Priestia megaterium TaxID=1404 RepID=UPI002E247BD0|nr:hypothetical protein [Priestia megaterium]
MNTLDEMKSYELTGSKDSSTESRFAGIPMEGWEVNAIGDNHEIIDDEKKGEMIQNTLLTFYFHREKN